LSQHRDVNHSNKHLSTSLTWGFTPRINFVALFVKKTSQYGEVSSTMVSSSVRYRGYQLLASEKCGTCG